MQHPLVLRLVLVHRAQTDLVRAQLKARTHLRQGNGLVVLAGVCVVAEGDEVSDRETTMPNLPLVGKRQDALAIHARHREYMLENVRDALAELRCEIAEDQVRVRLAHRAHVLDVVAHHRVGYVEVRRRAVREMAHDERRRLAAVLVDDHDVCEVVRSARLHELPIIVPSSSNLVQLGCTAVDALRVRNNQLDFLDEHLQTRTRIARGCHANLGVLDSRSGVLVIRMCLYGHAPPGKANLQLLRFVVFHIHHVLQLFSFISELCRHLLPG